MPSAKVNVEGQNVRIEYRWAHGAYDRLPTLTNDLLGLRVNVIVPFGTSAIRAANRGTGQQVQAPGACALSRICVERRPCKLRSQSPRPLSACRGLYCTGTQGHKAARFTGFAADHIRIGNQPAGRQNACFECATDAACPRRRGDRVILAIITSRGLGSQTTS